MEFEGLFYFLIKEPLFCAKTQFHRQESEKHKTTVFYLENIMNEIETRFWNKVDIRSENECWNFQGGINSTGRGIFRIGKNNIHAHRVAWMFTYGDIPENMQICHHCDNGKCVNPKHLFLGTQLDNMRDMIKKGRKVTRVGEDDPKSKLTEKEVLQIRRLWKQRFYSQFKIADQFSVSRSTIQAIVEKRIWKHI